jgi:hypothetical protein
MSYKNIVDVRGNPNDRIDKLISKMDSLTEQCNFTLTQIISHNAILKQRKPHKKTTITLRHRTCRWYLLDLFNKNWFETERSLRDVKEKLNDTHYESSSFSHALKTMVEKRQLKRLGTDRNYLYINDPVGFGSRNLSSTLSVD